MKTAPQRKLGAEVDVIRPEKAFEFSDKPCDSPSRTMKIRVKVVCSFLTLSKKPPPPFLNPGYTPENQGIRPFRTMAKSKLST